MPHGALQRFHQLPGAVFLETDQVDDDIRTEFPNPLAKAAGRFFLFPVQSDLLNLVPGGMRLIGGAAAAAHVDDGMAKADQAGNEVRPDMSRSADDDDAHAVLTP